MKKNAVVINPQDSVATAIQPLKAGDVANMFVGNENLTITLRLSLIHI